MRSGAPKRWRYGSAVLLGLAITTLADAGVRVSGLDKAQHDNVMAWLTLARLPEDASRSVVFRRFRQADKEINSALQALGHYSPVISRKLDFQDGQWQASFDIQAGPRTFVRSTSIRFQGPGAESLQAQFGQDGLTDLPLHHDKYRALKDRLLNVAVNRGYIDAEISSAKLLVNPEQARADIELIIDTGPQFRFGEIAIEQDILADSFLRRYVKIEPGDVFDADRLLELQLRLSDLDYFQTLDVSTRRPQEDQPLIDIDIVTTPKKPQRYQLGLGYGTDTGPRASLATEFRHLNRRGHRLRSDLRVAEKQQDWSARYLIPTGTEVGTNWSLKAGYAAEEFGDAKSEAWQWQLALTEVSGPRLWQYYVGYEIESFRVGEDPRSETKLLMPGTSLTLRRTDSDLNPRRGYKVFADVHGAHSAVVSSDSFLQMLVQSRLILPLGSKSRVLIRGQAGYSIVGEISELPLSQRFFAGGDQSVRGYAYQSLGPTNERDEVIGGQYLSVASIELDRLLFRNYGLAVFFDYGGASDQPGESLFRGVGAGLRWRTAIGMVRADFAHPLDGDERGIRLHIGIGAEL